MEEILKRDLNSTQEKAVKNIQGPSLIIAGAGSGKTRVLTYRIAYMLAKGVPPAYILSLTFTNKAATEMKNRIQEMLGTKSGGIWMGTFHSIFARILRQEASYLKYTRYFTIYDAADSKSLIKKIITNMHLDVKQYPPKEMQGRISKSKNNLMTPAAYRNKPDLIEQDKKRQQSAFIDIYDKYNVQCRKDNVMDFDDLLVNTNILFRKFPDVLAKYQAQFQYILVDEYQDTNYAQYLILKNLAAAHKNISVVGDDAQSIYAFRGARIENILNFKNDYPNYKVYKLEQNYRSTKTIVDAANSLISKNSNQLEKEVFSKNEDGIRVKVFQASTDTEEAQFVADDIFVTENETHKSLDEFAILYRTNAQSRQLEEALRKKDIKYRIYGGLSFYQRKEIKDLLAYFRLTVNPKDNEALKRIINFPSRKIGLKSIEKLENTAAKHEISIWELIVRPTIVESGLNKPTINRIQQFAVLMHDFQKKTEEMEAVVLASEILKKSGIHFELLNDKSPEGISRFENVQELINGIQDYTDEKKQENENAMIKLGDYLENVALLSTQDTMKDENEPKVSLMTIHAAKGLEFDNVYIAGVEEDLFPGRMSTFSRFDLEEERRLFYVAMTRAREKLVITHAGSRYRYGSVQFNDPSRFINEISPEFIEFSGSSNPPVSDPFETMFDDQPEPKSFEKKEKPALRHKSSPAKKLMQTRRLRPIEKHNIQPDIENATDTNELVEGQAVKHARFGKGVILSLHKENNDTKAIVQFELHGEKTLLLKFAKLKRID
ncbi:MAG: 3'-5' exonuclease [Bacteroidota bacterium]|nr:3'-5' exonuclease [Bacteroidota bacterium]